MTGRWSGGTFDNGDGTWSTVISNSSGGSPIPATDTLVGAVTETAPATDTASSGLNGRLQRIAQRLTSLIALLPTALTSGGGLKTGIVDALPSRGYASGKVLVTRPNDTTAYAIGDVVGGVITFPTMGPAAGGEVILTSLTFERDLAAVVSGETSYTLHLYSVTPPSALADNAAWDLPSGDRASYLGPISISTPTDLGSTLYVAVDQINRQVTLASATVYGYMVTATAFTPAAQTVNQYNLHSVAA